MTITHRLLRDSSHWRYKAAREYTFDTEYELVDKELIAKAYSQFIWQMKLLGLTRWLKNKLDCDKWAWLFKAYITVRNALSKRKHGIPVGILCYYVDGDRTKPHMINTFMCHEDGKFKLLELEPQPGGGIKELTQKERDTAWLVAF